MSVNPDEPGLHALDNKDQLLKQTMDLIRSARLMAMGCIDANGRLRLASLGVSYDDLPRMLRSFADHIERDADIVKEQAKRQIVESMIEQLPPDRKGTCPQCSQTVVLTKPIPAAFLERRDDHVPVCVCTCGAFLKPFRNEGDEALQLRFMTIEEIAELPDEIRMQLVRARNLFASRQEAE